MYLVRKARPPNAGTLYAMKVLKKAKIISSDKDTAHIKSERNILGKFLVIQLFSLKISILIGDWTEPIFKVIFRIDQASVYCQSSLCIPDEGKSISDS